jgi:hypothetical protein
MPDRRLPPEMRDSISERRADAKFLRSCEAAIRSTPSPSELEPCEFGCPDRPGRMRFQRKIIAYCISHSRKPAKRVVN